MEIRLIYHDTNDLVRGLGVTAKQVHDRLTHFMGKSVRLLSRRIAELAPLGATSRLKASFYSRVIKQGDKVIGIVTHHDGAFYAGYVNNGTEPHQVPPKRLIPWASAKLGSPVAAYAVSDKIAREGSPGQFFFERALEEVRPTIDADFERAAASFGGPL